MLLLKKEKQTDSKVVKEQKINLKKQNVLIELKERELRPQPSLSLEPGLIVGVLGFAKVGKSKILQSLIDEVDLIPTKRVSLTSSGYGLILIDTPPITFKSKKSVPKEITEFIMRACHVILLVTDVEKNKDLIDHVKSCYKASSDNFKPHVIVIWNKSKTISDSQLDDIKKFYKKHLQGIDINFTNNTTQPKLSRPLFINSLPGPVHAADTVNLYKLPIIDMIPTFSDQARFEVACEQLKRDLFSIQPLEREGRWRMSEQEWFNFANMEWQNILKRSK